MKQISIVLLFFLVALNVPGVKGQIEKGLGFVAPTIVDRNNVYQPVAGEIVYDQNVGDFYGRKHDSTWVSLGSTSVGAVPSGTILPFAGTVAPTGYVLCDGSAISRTTYADLFTVVGTSFGEGDGSSTFNLPDLRGQFLRGADNGAGVDPDASTRTACNSGGATGDAVGSCQGNELLSHNHMEAMRFNPDRSYVFGMGTGPSTGMVYSGASISAATSHGLTSSTGGNETRPKNVSVNYIIKL